MIEFIIKMSVITLCLVVVLCFAERLIPKYNFIDSEHRGNVMTGCLERFSNWDHTWK